jgi:CubicO group peptidase (beta-lactamase class C family)
MESTPHSETALPTTPDPARRLHAAVAAGRLDGLHAVVALHGGATVLEHYGEGEDSSWGQSHGVVRFGPSTLHDLRSVSKSVTAALYGIALADGHVPGPEEPLLAHFPQYPDLAGQPERARLTVGHALTMSLGLEWREDIPYDSPDNAEIAMELAPDRYRFVLERPVTEDPGVRWSYCGGATALLGKLIADGTGRPLPEYARDVLFAPLGIGDFQWMAGMDGVASPASGLRLTTPDLARIGQVVLAGGRWQGRQVVPEQWLGEALRPRLRADEWLEYGYQWYLGWFDHGDGGRVRWLGGLGNGGQRLYLLPELDLVVAVFAGNYDVPDQWITPHRVVTEVLLPWSREI